MTNLQKLIKKAALRTQNRDQYVARKGSEKMVTKSISQITKIT